VRPVQELPVPIFWAIAIPILIQEEMTPVTAGLNKNIFTSSAGESLQKDYTTCLGDVKL
jgi:hypothetical protein